MTLPGREGYPDWRIAVVDTVGRRVLRWIDLRPLGEADGTRPIGVGSVSRSTPSHLSHVLSSSSLNQYANFASVIDTGYRRGDRRVRNRTSMAKISSSTSRARGCIITDRFRDQVRVFRIDPGPFFTQIAAIPTGTNDLDRANPRDLDLSADGNDALCREHARPHHCADQRGRRCQHARRRSSRWVASRPM